jgi:hypothetical protein
MIRKYGMMMLNNDIGFPCVCWYRKAKHFSFLFFLTLGGSKKKKKSIMNEPNPQCQSNSAGRISLGQWSIFFVFYPIFAQQNFLNFKIQCELNVSPRFNLFTFY